MHENNEATQLLTNKEMYKLTVEGEHGKIKLFINKNLTINNILASLQYDG